MYPIFSKRRLIGCISYMCIIGLDYNFRIDRFTSLFIKFLVMIFYGNMSLYCFYLKQFLYWQVAKSNPERSIPLSVLKSAQGLAILTVVKAGALVSYKVGTGLVVARRYDGSWSAPSAICSMGLGWGAQVRRLYMGLVHV